MAKPFFKWAGGKAALVPRLAELLPDDYRERRHVEPFLGGGALFFALEPKTALLSDINYPLVEAYRTVARDPEYIIRGLKRRLREHSKDRELDRAGRLFYRSRERFNSGGCRSTGELALLFLYLNKTCFNGLYRENRNGEFNVPLGDYKELRVDAEAILDASRVLRATGVTVRKTGYAGVIGDVRSKDFVYLDPPYYDVFSSYASNGFDVLDQKILSSVFKNLSSIPRIKLMLSNSDTPLIRELYRDFNITRIDAPRNISSNGSRRNSVSELVIRNYG